MNIGERIREERLRLGLSQVDFGGITRVSKTTQFNYESGDRSPDANYLMMAANAGVDVMYVLTGVRTAGDAAKLSPRETLLLDHFNKLSEEDRCAIERLISVIPKQKS